MPKRSPIDQLDLALDALLAGRAPAEALDRDIVQILELVPVLRDLPSEQFRARLKSEFTKESNMSRSSQAEATPSETAAKQPSVVPYPAVVEADQVVKFVEKAFGAEGKIMGYGSEGGFHSEYRIGDGMIMIGGGPKWRNPKPRRAAIHLYVDNADETYRRAIAAGATSISAPVDQPYGDREATVQDAGGNYWFIGQLRDRDRPQGLRAITTTFMAHDATAFIDFLKQAFSAEEVAIHKSPEGTVLHAQIRIGDTVVELSEAHGRWQPMQTTIFLTVPDCDRAYEQAVRAGAKSVAAPNNAPYGFRLATVDDPQGNTWYITAPITNEK